MSAVSAADGPSVLGVYLGHDLGACLLQDGEVAVCIEEERLNRFKHGRPNSVAGLWPQFGGKFGYFPWASVCYCLEARGMSIDDLDLIVVGDALWAAAAADTIRSIVPVRDKKKIVFVNEPRGAVHHYHHALSTFFASPYESAAVLVVDGDGNSNEDGYEAETGYLFEDRSGGHRLVFKNRYRDKQIPKSGVGWMYEQVTLLLGFANASIFLADPGKTMGLAPYGQPRPDLENRWITWQGFNLDFSGFHTWLHETGYASRLLSYRGGLATWNGGPTQYAKDVAFKVQKELEGVMSHLAEEMHRATGAENLCLAGGVALNSVANALIAEYGPFENVFIVPSAYDGGQAIGLAYHGHLMLTTGSPYVPASVLGAVPAPHVNGNGRIRPLRHAYGGRTYCLAECRELLNTSKLPFADLSGDEALAESAAADLEAGSIVGWMQGGSEIGPRALGHRSILANPCGDHVKDYLNKHVKFREAFRPFAPSVLLEHAHEVFEMDGDSPYMLLVAPVREAWRSRVPAIVHVDQTARVQTIDASVEPRYHALVSAFYRRTGVPLVLNTSFNVQSMPLVESPYDALHCFLCTDIDVLYMELFRIERPGPERLFPLKGKGWDFTVSREVSGNGFVLVAQRDDRSREVRVPVNAESLACLELLDGTMSLQAAHARAAGAPPNGAGLQRVREIVQLLARHGALKLRAGGVTYGMPDPETHWWQVARAQRAD